MTMLGGPVLIASPALVLARIVAATAPNTSMLMALVRVLMAAGG